MLRAKFPRMGLTFALLFVLGACASKQQQQADQGELAEANAQNANSDEPLAPSSEQQAETQSGLENPAAATEEPAQMAQAVPEPMPQAAPMPEQATPLANTAPLANAAPANANVAPIDANRELRFVIADGTPVYQAAAETSAVVAKLSKGDTVVVAFANDWAQISSEKYVRNSALAKKAVPRDFTNGHWVEKTALAPTHPKENTAPIQEAAPMQAPTEIPAANTNSSLPAPGPNAADLDKNRQSQDLSLVNFD